MFLSNMKKISIGISAFNEEKNIANLMFSLFDQKLTVGKIIEVMVISYGSTDSTVDVLRGLKVKRLKIIDEKQRLGKNFRINQMLKRFTGDILILVDGDVLLEDVNVIDNMAKKFTHNGSVGLVAGNAQPLEGGTIAARAFSNFVKSLNLMKSKIKQGNNVYSVRGPLLGLSRGFAEKLFIPKNVPDDRFCYFECVRLGFPSAYEENAKVWFKSAQNIHEQISQGIRYKRDRENLNEVVDAGLLNKEYYIPFYLKIYGLFLQIWKDPLAYFVMKYIQVRVIISREENMQDSWRLIATSKDLFI